ncbi:HAMP domain-containing histidine kinase [Patescibacteria group bacterium]|nr:HAMP domain-containing histidine kinase [Patescibacteria group bacterium]
MENKNPSSEKYIRLARINEFITYFVVFSGLAVIQLPIPQDFDKNNIYLLTLVAILFTFVWHRLIPKRYSGLAKNTAEALIDILAIFVLVSITGGIRSYFSFIYFLPVLSSTVYMPLRTSLLVVLVASVLIFSQLVGSFGTNDFPGLVGLAALQIWAVWLIASYGRFLGGEIDIAKKKEEETKLEEIHEVDILKDEFIFIISHELRSPITVIRGYLEILTSESSEKLDTKIKSILDKAFITSNKLAGLVSLLLEVARLETGKIKFYIQSVSVKESLDKVYYNLKSELKEKNISLSSKIPGDFRAKVDGERLEEILSIIIENSINFTPEFGKVEITSEKKEGVIEIKVADNGVGMSQEKKEHLFEKFYTEKTGLERTDIKGINIGMYVVKQLLLKMSGNISIDSEIGKGTTFIITIPDAKQN